jgi:hypothetical protein
MTDRIAFMILALVVFSGCRSAKSESNANFSGFDLVDKTGNIRKPSGYRAHFQALGAYTVLKPSGNEMHAVYASPARPSITARLARLRMEPSLVKEVFGTDHAQLTTGDAYWASQTKVWFVLIKDTKGRYPGNPLWGDGWGWALFKSDAPDKQVAVDYEKGCLGCHVPAKATDWIYVQG